MHCEETQNMRYKTISWETYHDSGALKTVSKSHYINPDNPGYTLCGRRIPNEIEGWENDTCGRCLAIEEKEDTRGDTK